MAAILKQINTNQSFYKVIIGYGVFNSLLLSSSACAISKIAYGVLPQNLSRVTLPVAFTATLFFSAAAIYSKKHENKNLTGITLTCAIQSAGITIASIASSYLGLSLIPSLALSVVLASSASIGAFSSNKVLRPINAVLTQLAKKL